MKCHLIINQLGEMVRCTVTSGNVVDNNGKLLFCLTKDLMGYFFGDKGYMLNKEKKTFLEREGELKFVTKDKKEHEKDGAWTWAEPMI